jgi:hypothetical protein
MRRLCLLSLIAVLNGAPAVLSAQHSTPESLLVRGARARGDSNYVLAIALLDSAASYSSVALPAYFHGVIARFDLGVLALDSARQRHSCSDARTAERWLTSADSLHEVFDSVRFRPDTTIKGRRRTCNDCNADYVHRYLGEAKRSVRRYCR